MCLLWLFFYFKQKTAYEMRISDWSSDVCSSDLRHAVVGGGDDLRRRHRLGVDFGGQVAVDGKGGDPVEHRLRLGGQRGGRNECERHGSESLVAEHRLSPRKRKERWRTTPRSAEHTSELQSLMRISYAVFCLKKKKK